MSSSLLSLVNKEVSILPRDLHPRSADPVHLGNPLGAALGTSSAGSCPPPPAAPGPTSSPGTDFRVPTPVQGRRRTQQGVHTEGGHGRTRGCLLQPWTSRHPYPAPVSVVDETSDVRQVSSFRLSQLSPPRRQGMGDVIRCGAATFNLARASDPLGKDGGTGSYWESPIQGSGWPRTCISDWLPGEAETPL